MNPGRKKVAKTIQFNTVAILFVDAPVGCHFRIVGRDTIYIKVSPWHVRRLGSKVERRIGTGTMVYVETPSWSL